MPGNAAWMAEIISHLWSLFFRKGTRDRAWGTPQFLIPCSLARSQLRLGMFPLDWALWICSLGSSQGTSELLSGTGWETCCSLRRADHSRGIRFVGREGCGLGCLWGMADAQEIQASPPPPTYTSRSPCLAWVGCAIGSFTSERPRALALICKPGAAPIRHGHQPCPGGGPLGQEAAVRLPQSRAA